MSRKFTPEEVARHNDCADLWLVIHGKVYDLSKFVKEHPGGEEVLISLAGEDATKCFDDIGHSMEAKLLKDTFEIGDLDGRMESAEDKKQPTLEDDDDWVYEEPKKESSPYLPLFIALGVLVYGVLFYYLFL